MWRFIPFQKYDPYFKTGLNKALIESVSTSSQPVIFLTGWKEKCVNLGYNQKIDEEVNTEKLKKRKDIKIVRRQGGGGTTYLTPTGEITWGITAPSKKYPNDVNKIYQEVCKKVANGLKPIDIEAEHEPINDIVTEKGKISGATIKQKNDVVYIGGTLMYKNNPKEMFSILTPSEDKKKDKQIEDYRNRVSSIKKESDATFQQTKQALKNSLLKNKNYKTSKLKESETERAQELADKYSSKKWLYRNES